MDKFMNYDFNITKIVFVNYLQASYDKAIHKDRLNHGLALHMAGDKDYIFQNGTSLRVQAGSIIYLPKHSFYEVACRKIGDCYAINFELDEDITFPPFVMQLKNCADAEKCFQRAANAWKMQKNEENIKCKAELYGLIYILMKQYFSEYMPSEKFEIIKPAVDAMHRTCLSGELCVEKLADRCGVSAVYFRKLFKSFYGVSPIKYINDLKISHAKTLLQSQMYSVSEVARQSGFSDATHFSREFKKITGTSPSRYKLKPSN
ncbi:MAG: helix-turn-helix transcriptional regulator [Clostridia bacterium]|nr:helix-turn-helix transcriptional regulator [Clostridia bacterium]